jgi:hypothetical protein
VQRRRRIRLFLVGVVVGALLGIYILVPWWTFIHHR